MRRQSWMYRGFVMAGLVLGLALPAQAALLEDKGSFAYTDGVGNTGFVNLIYDDDRNITWLADANLAQTSGFDDDGLMTWSAANAWAGGLTVGFGTDWRLPTTTQPDDTCSLPVGGEGFGFDCTGSEMGHLFNVEGITEAAPGVFSNVQVQAYWSGTVYSVDPDAAWLFDLNFGTQATGSKDAGLFAWAVHSGDVSVPAAVPVPSTMLLMGSGLVGLLAWRRFGRS